MNHPRSVLDRNPHDVASLMMASARSEQPPAPLRRHVITAIGGAGVAGTATSVASGTAAATAIAGSTATSAKLLVAGPLILAAKWGVVGIAAGVLTVGVAEQSAHVDRSGDGSNGALVISASDPNRSKVAPIGPPDRAAIPDQVATPASEAPAAPVDPSRSKLATGGAKPIALASKVTSVARPVEGADPPLAVAPEGTVRPSLGLLGAEVALLDEARSALSGHDPAHALRAIESYEQTFAAGLLQTEATALRIEALVANHEDAVAKNLGQRFLAANPRGPLANRVRGLLSSR